MTNLFGRIVTICAATLLAVPASSADFDIAPQLGTSHPLRLYATRYYVHYVSNAQGRDATPLLLRDGSPTGVGVAKNQFCFGALQGTMAVRKGAETSVYNVDGLTTQRSAVCSYRTLSTAVNNALGLQAWAKVTGNGYFGLGVRGLRLVPFRTVAVDPTFIPFGTVLYIPRLKGFVFDDEGTRRVHDGYVIAGDTGGAIKRNHIDFFTGNYVGTPPTFVTSRPTGLFDAQVVTDTAIVARLTADAKYHP